MSTLCSSDGTGTRLAGAHHLGVAGKQPVDCSHSLQVTDEHLQQVPQIPAQYLSVQGGKEQESTGLDEEQNPVLRPVTAVSKSLQPNGMRLKGLEPLTFSSVG